MNERRLGAQAYWQYKYNAIETILREYRKLAELVVKYDMTEISTVDDQLKRCKKVDANA